MLYPTPIAKLIDSYSKLLRYRYKNSYPFSFYTIGMEDDVVNEFAKIYWQARPILLLYLW